MIYEEGATVQWPERDTATRNWILIKGKKEKRIREGHTRSCAHRDNGHGLQAMGSIRQSRRIFSLSLSLFLGALEEILVPVNEQFLALRSNCQWRIRWRAYVPCACVAFLALFPSCISNYACSCPLPTTSKSAQGLKGRVWSVWNMKSMTRPLSSHTHGYSHAS